MFFDQIWPKVNSFGSRGHQMKNYRFSRRWFIIMSFWYQNTKIKMKPSYSPRRTGSEHAILTLKSQFQNLTSGQVRLRLGQDQIMTQVGQYANTPKRLDEPSRLALFARLYINPVATYWWKTVCDLIWPHLTPGNLPVTSDRQLHRHHHRWGEWQWSWYNWMVSVGLCETESIFIFPHRLMIGRSRNWPDLRSPG